MDKELKELKEQNEQKKEYKVPRLLWESLEAIMLAQGKRYVREMAKTLKVNEKELLKRVFPAKDTLNITLHDTTSTSLQCMAYMNGTITHLCRKPVLLGSDYCSSHQTMRAIVDTEPTLEKLGTDSKTPPLWLTKDGTVIDSSGTAKGAFHKKQGKLVLYTIAPT
jgi:hypothetical protein